MLFIECVWLFWTVVLEKTLESPWDFKEIKPVHPKGNQSWTFIGRTDAEAEAPILWPPDVKSQLIGKDPDAGKDWRQEEKGVTEDEMVGWHHWFNGHGFEQALGVGDEQGGLECCIPWGHKELDWATEQQQNCFASLLSPLLLFVLWFLSNTVIPYYLVSIFIFQDLKISLSLLNYFQWEVWFKYLTCLLPEEHIVFYFLKRD